MLNFRLKHDNSMILASIESSSYALFEYQSQIVRRIQHLAESATFDCVATNRNKRPSPNSSIQAQYNQFFVKLGQLYSATRGSSLLLDSDNAF